MDIARFANLPEIANTDEMSAELARRIKGAKYQTMIGLGHFPMSEDPVRCIEYVLPILDEIRMRAERSREVRKVEV